MSCTRIWTVIGVGAVVVITIAVVGVALIWRNHTVPPAQSHLTQQQAGSIADQYAADAIAHLPGSPKLGSKPKTTVPCDEPADNAPPDSAEIAAYYDLTFTTPSDNTQVFNQVYEYWTSKGYRTYTDSRNKPSQRTLAMQNPTDGFRIGVVEAAGGELTLVISSPCLAPGATNT
jgi:hypothetical protein